MTQVKFNNEKWWVLLNGSWVEVDQNDWNSIKYKICPCHNCRPNECTDSIIKNEIYSLPEEVEFEIREMCCANKQIRVDTQCASCSHWIKVAYLADPKIPNGLGERKEFGSVIVAHLKESEPKKPDFKNGDIITLNTGFSNDQGTFLRWEGDKAVWKDKDGDIYKSPISDYKITLVERSEEVNIQFVECSRCGKNYDPLNKNQADYHNWNRCEEVKKKPYLAEWVHLNKWVWNFGNNRWCRESENGNMISRTTEELANEWYQLQQSGKLKDSQSEIESLKAIIHGAEIEMQRVKEDEIPFLKEQIKELESKLANYPMTKVIEFLDKERLSYIDKRDSFKPITKDFAAYDLAVRICRKHLDYANTLGKLSPKEE